MGCTARQIDWEKGKNVTLKTVEKQQKHKGRGTVRTVTPTVSARLPLPELPSGCLGDDADAVLAAQSGHYLHERTVPRSALRFAGEATELR